MTDESRKAFESPCEEIRSFHAQLTDLENQNAALQARVKVLETAYKDLELLRCATAEALSVVHREREELLATLAAIDSEVGPEPTYEDLGPGVETIEHALALRLVDHYKHAAEHLALRNVRLVEALDEISGLSVALRSGGPDPMDLQWLSDALEESIGFANEAIAANAVKGEG